MKYYITGLKGFDEVMLHQIINSFYGKGESSCNIQILGLWRRQQGFFGSQFSVLRIMRNYG
jgi:hypothetical protein